uniref:CX domain-containing protein n=1 Tax=Globodera pallida TaxID=36090 RepID=A0A183C6N0_GLOPA
MGARKKKLLRRSPPACASPFCCSPSFQFLAASMAGIPGTLQAYAGALGEVCGTGSFIHYWTCCEDYPFECCFHFQPWAIVVLAMIAVIVVAVLLFGIGRFLIAMQSRKNLVYEVVVVVS